ncbi:MAG: hypothetical protein BMS9Abin37_0907 [Acidobacteriota bacterium]|nr:MAG: hypothetical protein BMS9Abin37_0907 [Acidobacteriota bacterium]
MIWTSLIAQGKRQLAMSVLVATLLAVVFFHFARFYQGSAWSWLFTLGWVPILLNLLHAALNLLYRLDRQPFRAFDVGLVSDQVAPGEAFAIEIRIETRRETTLGRMSAELRCTRQKSTDRGRQLSVLDANVRVLEENLELGAGAKKDYRVSLPVPPGAPFSFRSMEGKLAWTLHITADVEGWGELTDELEVTVAPG